MTKKLVKLPGGTIIEREELRAMATQARNLALGVSERLWPEWHYGNRVADLEEFESQVLLHMCIKHVLKHHE